MNTEGRDRMGQGKKKEEGDGREERDRESKRARERVYRNTNRFKKYWCHHTLL